MDHLSFKNTWSRTLKRYGALQFLKHFLFQNAYPGNMDITAVIIVANVLKTPHVITWLDLVQDLAEQENKSHYVSKVIFPHHIYI